MPSPNLSTVPSQEFMSGFQLSQGQQQDPMMNMFAKLMQPQNIMSNLLTGGALSAGTTLLSGLAGLARGKTEQQKRAESVFNLAQNRLGQNVFDPTQVLSKISASMRPEMTKASEQISRRLGLDAGVAQGELAAIQFPTLLRLGAELNVQSNQMTAERDINLLRLMAQSNLAT